MRKGMMGVLAAGLATASLVAVTSSAEAQWRGHGGWGGGGARVAGFGGGGAWRGAYGGGWRGGYGHAWRGGYNRGWGGGGALAAGAVLGAVTGAALASNYGYGGYGGYYGGYAPVSYGYAPAAYAYPAAVSYYEEYPTTVSYAVPAYRPRVVQRVAYYPRRAYRTVRVVAPRRAVYRSVYRSGYRAAAYSGPARGHFVRSHVVRHRWH